MLIGELFLKFSKTPNVDHMQVDLSQMVCIFMSTHCRQLSMTLSSHLWPAEATEPPARMPV